MTLLLVRIVSSSNYLFENFLQIILASTVTAAASTGLTDVPRSVKTNVAEKASTQIEVRLS